MARSILQDRRECYICREIYCVKSVWGLEEHHVFGGPRRALSERYGLKIYLCRRHHNTPGEFAAHFDPDVRNWLHRRAQRAFVARHDREQWMEVFGKDYDHEQ